MISTQTINPLNLPWLVVFGAATAVFLLFIPKILRRLPPPEDMDPKSYSRLVVPRFLCGWAAVVVLAFGSSWVFLPGTAGAWWWPVSTFLVLAAAIDSQTRLLPRSLIWTALVLEIALVLGFGGDLSAGVVGGGTWGFCYWVVWRIGAGLGFGDVRLGLALGFATGTHGLPITLIAMTVAAGAAILQTRCRDGPVPFGPPMVAASLFVPQAAAFWVA